MTNITVYYDGFFNNFDNYISYNILEILVNEQMHFQELHNSLRSKLIKILIEQSFSIES